MMKSATTFALVTLFAAGGCSSSGGTSHDGGADRPGTGGAASSTGSGAWVGSGGAIALGGSGGHGGAGAAAGAMGTGGVVATGGSGGHGAAAGAGGASGAGGAAGGGGSGGHAGAGGGGAASGGHGGAGGAAAGGHGGAGGGAAGGGGAPGSLHATYSQVLPASSGAPIGALVAVDSNDTAIVVAPSTGSATSDPGPTITWFPAQGQPHSLSYPNAVTPAAMAVDATGTIWLVGQLYQTVSFGGSTTVQPVTNGYYLAHLGADGSPLATYPVTRDDVTVAATMALDASGNVYVAGGVLLTSGTLGSYVFVTKFSPTGAQIYDKTFAGSDTEAMAQAMAIAPNGTVVLGGFFDSTLQIGSKSLQSAAGLSSNGFFAVLDPSTGDPLGAFSFGGTVVDVASSVTVTSAGNIRMAGSLTGSITLGGMTVQADPDGSAFIAEVTPAGQAQWIDIVGSGTPGTLFQTAINAADLSFAVGHLTRAAATDAIVAEVAGANQVTIPVDVANADGNGATACAADHHGGVWVTGEFMGTTDLGTGTLIAADPTLPSNFVVHLQR